MFCLKHMKAIDSDRQSSPAKWLAFSLVVHSEGTGFDSPGLTKIHLGSVCTACRQYGDGSQLRTAGATLQGGS